jgi:naphthoate synthase
MEWTRVREFEDIEYDKAEGIARITIARPEVHNSFRPQTLFDLSGGLRRRQGGPGRSASSC